MSWFRRRRVGVVRVLLLGDSTVIGGACRRVMPRADHLEDIVRKRVAAVRGVPPVEVINLGRDGETIEGLLSARYDREVAPLAPFAFAFVRYGINDRGKRADFRAHFPEDYRALARRLRDDAPGCEVVAETIVPQLPEPGDRKVNDLIRAVAGSERLPLLDTHARFSEALRHGPTMLYYRSLPLAAIPPEVRPLLPRRSVRRGHVIVLDNLLDAHLRGLPGWLDDRHPNLAGYHVIGRGIAEHLAGRLRASGAVR